MARLRRERFPGDCECLRPRHVGTAPIHLPNGRDGDEVLVRSDSGILTPDSQIINCFVLATKIILIPLCALEKVKGPSSLLNGILHRITEIIPVVAQLGQVSLWSADIAEHQVTEELCSPAAGDGAPADAVVPTPRVSVNQQLESGCGHCWHLGIDIIRCVAGRSAGMEGDPEPVWRPPTRRGGGLDSAG